MPAITPACSTMASAAAAADQASVRGDSAAKNSAMRSAKLSSRCCRRHRSPRRQSIDLGEQRLDIAVRRRGRFLIDIDLLREFRAHPFEAAGELRIVGERRFHFGRSRRLTCLRHTRASSSSISLGSCPLAVRFVGSWLVGFMASPARCRAPPAARTISCAHKTSASSRSPPECRQFQKLPPPIYADSRRD